MDHNRNRELANEVLQIKRYELERLARRLADVRRRREYWRRRWRSNQDILAEGYALWIREPYDGPPRRHMRLRIVVRVIPMLLCLLVGALGAWTSGVLPVPLWVVLAVPACAVAGALMRWVTDLEDGE